MVDFRTQIDVRGSLNRPMEFEFNERVITVMISSDYIGKSLSLSSIEDNIQLFIPMEPIIEALKVVVND